MIAINANGDWVRVGPGADLSGADLSGADLHGVDLRGADLSGVKAGHGTDFSGATM